MDWIKKLIPFYIEIRSMYWVEYGIKMDTALGDIFDALDHDLYAKASRLIEDFETTFTQSGVPYWIAVKYSEIYRAKSELVCLDN
jgi:hypothetical protein